jgi:phosphomannomutase
VFLKAAMRREGAICGGKMPARHCFRDFMACDSGVIPWPLVAGLVTLSGTSRADMAAALRRDCTSSREINFSVADSAAMVARVRKALAPKARKEDLADGLSLDFGDWRLSLRASKTEFFQQLSVEARGIAGLVDTGLGLIRGMILG